MTSYFVLERPGGQIGLRVFAGACSPLCLWLPGKTGNFDTVLAGDPRNPKWLLADAGATVYAMDYRTHFAADDRWGLDVLVADVAAAVDAVRARHGLQQIVLIGHSTGAKLAYLYAARHPRALAGLVVLDGWLCGPPHLPPVPAPAPPRLSHEAAIPANRREQFIAYLRHSLTSEDGAPAGRMAGPMATEESLDTLLRCVLLGDRFWPLLAEREVRAVAEEEIARVKTPLLNIIAKDRGHAFTERSLHTGRLARNALRREVMLDGFGHLDLVVGCHLGMTVCRPILDWIADLQLSAPRGNIVRA
ncbi:alpha/beta hydrolase [Streptosporangium sandarakinum]|uniref:alpha/beta hydrolase n=1 Tax=Streptosporangium sandarakinum TaxID=1260955 RepID=UPI003420CEA7